MTLVAAWVNLERPDVPTIWTVADTKISDNRVTELTAQGAKVLELPVLCKNLSSPVQEAYFQTSIGFAFAGSTLIGLNSYATLCTILTNIGSSISRRAVPDHLSILDKTKQIITKYSQEIRSTVEICLYGFCPKANLPFIGTIRPQQVNGILEYTVEVQTGIVSDLSVISLGETTGISKLDELTKKLLATYDSFSHDYWRAPFYALDKIVVDALFPTIGGALQLTITSQARFDHYWLPGRENKDANNSMRFRNLDMMDDIGLTLGECWVAITGLDADYPEWDAL